MVVVFSRYLVTWRNKYRQAAGYSLYTCDFPRYKQNTSLSASHLNLWTFQTLRPGWLLWNFLERKQNQVVVITVRLQVLGMRQRPMFFGVCLFVGAVTVELIKFVKK